MQRPSARGGNPALSIVLFLVGAFFLAVMVFYATQKTSILAHSTAYHYKHAAIAGVLAVVSFLAAAAARRS